MLINVVLHSAHTSLALQSLETLMRRPGLLSLTMLPKPTFWTKKVPVFYSMGNLVSNQRVETMSGDGFHGPPRVP